MAAAPFSWTIRLLVGQALDYWIDHGGLSFFDAYRADPTFVGRKCTFVWDRPAESNESTRDTLMSSFALFKISGTDPEPSWDTSDYTNAETIIETWWAATKGLFPSVLKFEEVRWYQEGPAITPPNPAVRVTSIASSATGSLPGLPPQVSSTVTLQTASRKYWGRMYMPAFRSSALSSISADDGRWDHSYVDELCSNTASMFNDLGGIGLIPAVYSRAGKAFLSVVGFEVDDVPDIQRRRRFASTGYKKLVAAA